MVRKYKRKSTRGQYGNQQLTLALEAVKGGMPLLRASKEFDIPRRTIRRHRDRLVANPGVSRLGRHRVILTENIEKELNDHIQYMEKSLYGLTTRDVRRLAYELAEAVGLQHPFSHDRKMAGKDWLSGFLTRHQNLSIREPQGTNLSRAVGFNKPKVQQFFGVYKELLQSEEFTPARVWNMDETGITSVHKPGKILATKGVKQVSRMTSGERGKTVTVICGMNAAGIYVPPMLIFPRKRMVDALMAGAPPQAVGYASPNGWTDAELFLRWLEHFVNFTNASKDVKQIIILDGHHSHKTLAAVTYAREHGLHILTLPPHSTHKMQPLDRTYFKSLKSGYNAACDSWMVANPGKRISFFEMAAIFGKAYLKSATPEKAVGGFACCGIWPFDENIFPDSEFAAAAVTDEPEPQRETANGQDTPITELTGTVRSTEKQPSAAIGEEETFGSSSEEATQLPPPSVPGPSTQDVPGSTALQNLIRSLSPTPKLATSRARKRKAEGAALLTSSPYKAMLEEKPSSKDGKGKRGRRAAVNSSGKKNGKGNVKGKGTVEKTKDACEDSSDEDEVWPCLICGEPFSNSKSREIWVRCVTCLQWAHEECTNGEKVFLCPNCESDQDSEDSSD